MSEIERPSIVDAAARAALGMVPVVGPVLVEMWTYGRQLDEQRIEQMALAAQNAAGDDERFSRRLREDERLVDMLMVAVDGARRTSWEAKRIVMGRVLGQATTDDADIDDHAALLAALGALDAVHFRFLATIAANLQQASVTGILVPEPYRSQLIAEGVVQTGSTFDGRTDIIAVSPFGHELTAWIREAEGPHEDHF